MTRYHLEQFRPDWKTLADDCHCEERSDAAIPRLTSGASSGGGLPRRCAPRNDKFKLRGKP